MRFTVQIHNFVHLDPIYFVRFYEMLACLALPPPEWWGGGVTEGGTKAFASFFRCFVFFGIFCLYYFRRIVFISFPSL